MNREAHNRRNAGFSCSQPVAISVSIASASRRSCCVPRRNRPRTYVP
jgi:hypothetical protein